MLQAIFYAEFDNITGPRVVFDAPKGFMSEVKCQVVHETKLTERASLFDAISDYAITGPQVSGRVFTVRAASFNVKVLNFPLVIHSHEIPDHRDYDRNALLFSIGFAVSASCPAVRYTAALRKLTLTLRAMEIESAFLSDPSKKAALASLLPRLLQDLNVSGECTIVLDPANVLFLRLPPPPPSRSSSLYSPVHLAPPAEGGEDPSAPLAQNESVSSFASWSSSSSPIPSTPMLSLAQTPPWATRSPHQPVGIHEVPVLLFDAHKLMRIDWDLGLHQVLHHVNGVRCIKMIAVASEVDVQLCQRCMQVLLWHRCIAIVDLFRYSNEYATLPALSRLVHECREPYRTQSLEGMTASSGGMESNSGQHFSTGSGGERRTSLLDEALRFSAQPLHPETLGSGGIGSGKTPSSGSAPLLGTMYPLSHRDIIHFFLAFGSGRSVKDVLLAHPDRFAQTIDHRRLVGFGVMHGILRRIHEFPIFEGDLGFALNTIRRPRLNSAENYDVPPPSPAAAASPNCPDDKAQETMLDMMDGAHCVDEICTEVEATYMEVKNFATRMGCVVVSQ